MDRDVRRGGTEKVRRVRAAHAAAQHRPPHLIAQVLAQAVGAEERQEHDREHRHLHEQRAGLQVIEGGAEVVGLLAEQAQQDRNQHDRVQ